MGLQPISNRNVVWRSKLTEFVKNGIEDPAYSLTSSTGVVADDGRVGAGDLALLNIGGGGGGVGGDVDVIGREAVLGSFLEEWQ